MQRSNSAVLKGNLEAINQCVILIEKVSVEQYVWADHPSFSSSMGAHFRHILDIYSAITRALNKAHQGGEVLIDYDSRRRGALCESQPGIAKEEFLALRDWINSCSEEQLSLSVTVKTEVTLNETESLVLSSTLIRELVFASSHAVHHLAIVSILARLQNIPLEDGFGVAPATATFLRENSR